MLGTVDQMTGATANQNALAKRYSLSALASSRLLSPGSVEGPAIMPARPDRNGIAANVAATIWSCLRPPSRPSERMPYPFDRRMLIFHLGSQLDKGRRARLARPIFTSAGRTGDQ